MNNNNSTTPEWKKEYIRIYKVNSFNNGFDLNCLTPFEIKQFYLDVKGNRETRVRFVEPDDYTMTTIISNGIETLKQETKITKDQYDIYLDNILGKIVRKRRYLISTGNGLNAEYDIREDRVKTIKFRFNDITEAENFKLPWWCEDSEEITNDPTYRSKTYALGGKTIEQIQEEVIDKANTKQRSD